MGDKESEVLHKICKSGDVGALNAFLKEAKTEKDLTIKDYKRRTPFHYACKYGHYEVAKILMNRLSREAMITFDENGYTPLHLACEKGRVAIVKDLIERLHHDDLILQTPGKRTPLYCGMFNPDIVYVLARKLHGEDFMIRDYHGSITLLQAVTLDFYDTADVLMAFMRTEDTIYSLKQYRLYLNPSIQKFLENPKITKQRLREKWPVPDTWKAAEYFSLVVGVSDDYFAIDRDIIRFFDILKELPMELQMLICNRVAGLRNDNIKKKNIDDAIVELY